MQEASLTMVDMNEPLAVFFSSLLTGTQTLIFWNMKTKAWDKGGEIRKEPTSEYSMEQSSHIVLIHSPPSIIYMGEISSFLLKAKLFGIIFHLQKNFILTHISSQESYIFSFGVMEESSSEFFPISHERNHTGEPTEANLAGCDEH